MTRITENAIPDHEELIFACSKGRGEYLRLRWDDDVPGWRCLWIEGVRVERTWKQRLSTVVDVLSGRQVNCGEVILSRDTLVALNEFFAEKVESVNRK